MDADPSLTVLPRGRRDLVLELLTDPSAPSLAPAFAAEVQAVVVAGDGPLLEDGRRRAAAADVANVLFVRARPDALPFPDGSFHSGLWRAGLHRRPDPGADLAEVRRVLAPRGWLSLTDAVCDEDPALAERQRALAAGHEDPAGRMLRPSELQDQLVRAGFEVAAAQMISGTHQSLLALNRDA